VAENINLTLNPRDLGVTPNNWRDDRRRRDAAESTANNYPVGQQPMSPVGSITRAVL
jgi:hypothetical protein